MNNITQPSKLLERFFFEGKAFQISAGQLIQTASTTPDGVYWIARGYVRIFIKNNGEGEKLHAIYKSGEIFPLLWALKDIHKPFFYKALGETTLYRVSKSAFRTFIHDNPSVALEVIDKLALQFNVLMERVDNLIIPKAYPRILARLLFFADRFGKQDGEKTVIEAPINQSTIADSIAVTRETVSRELAKMNRRGLIEYKNRFLVIKNKEKLIKELAVLSGIAIFFVDSGLLQSLYF